MRFFRVHGHDVSGGYDLPGHERAPEPIMVFWEAPPLVQLAKISFATGPGVPKYAEMRNTITDEPNCTVVLMHEVGQIVTANFLGEKGQTLLTLTLTYDPREKIPSVKSSLTEKQLKALNKRRERLDYKNTKDDMDLPGIVGSFRVPRSMEVPPNPYAHHRRLADSD